MGGEDIAATEDHGIVSYLATASRGDKSLRSHEALIIHPIDGGWGECFLYLFDQYAFDEFWS